MKVFVVYGPGGRFLGYVRGTDADKAAAEGMRRPWKNGPAMRVVPAGTAALTDPKLPAWAREILLAEHRS